LPPVPAEVPPLLEPPDPGSADPLDPPEAVEGPEVDAEQAAVAKPSETRKWVIASCEPRMGANTNMPRRAWKPNLQTDGSATMRTIFCRHFDGRSVRTVAE
jgi:hypothetical protein